jgi:hypothetical protein
VDEIYPAGYHSATWARDEALGAGLYFISLQFGTENATHKVVLFK